MIKVKLAVQVLRVFKKFVSVLIAIYVSGCGLLNAENQEELYKKTFQERRRPVYNPGGVRFSTQKDFYNAYMKKHRGVIGPVSNHMSGLQLSEAGKQGKTGSGADGRPDGIRLIDAMSAEKKLIPKAKSLSPQAKLPFTEKNRPIPVNKEYAGKSVTSFSHQAQQKQITRNYVDIRSDIANVGKNSPIVYDVPDAVDNSLHDKESKSNGQYVEKFAERNAPMPAKNSAMQSSKPALPADNKKSSNDVNAEQKKSIALRARKPAQEVVLQQSGTDGENNDDIENIVKKLYE